MFYKEDGTLITSAAETKTVFAHKFVGMLGREIIEWVSSLAREILLFYRDLEPGDTNFFASAIVP